MIRKKSQNYEEEKPDSIIRQLIRKKSQNCEEEEPDRIIRKKSQTVL